jgi:hypothetical protein
VTQPGRVPPTLLTRALLMLALAALAAGIVVAASSGSGAGEGPPPATGAAAIVPADALVYLHLSTDPSRPAVKHALALAARTPTSPALPALAADLGARLGAGGSIDFARDVLPWLGKEAAIALLDTTTSTAGALIVVDVADGPSARAFITRIGATHGAVDHGVQIFDRGSTEFAFVSHYLVIGPDSSIRAAIDVADGGARSLAQSEVYARAASGEPDGRVLDVYASASGVRRVLASQGGLAGALGALLYEPALQGLTVSVSAESPGMRVVVHSALDPTLAHLNGSAPRLFTPTLTADLPAGTLLGLDVEGLDRLAPRVLSAGASSGVGGGAQTLLSRLGAALASEGVGVRQLLSLFDGESAFAIAPGRGSSGAATSPGLVIVSRVADEDRARRLLASAELPLALLLRPPSSEATPSWTDRSVGDVTIHQLALPDRPELDYAVFRGLVVVSTSLSGIAAVANDAHPLSSSPAYRATLADSSGRVGSLLFLDFSQLLSLGEQTGLISGGRFAQLRGALARVRAVGLVSTSGEDETTAELSLQIS